MRLYLCKRPAHRKRDYKLSSTGYKSKELSACVIRSHSAHHFKPPRKAGETSSAIQTDWSIGRPGAHRLLQLTLGVPAQGRGESESLAGTTEEGLCQRGVEG